MLSQIIPPKGLISLFFYFLLPGMSGVELLVAAFPLVNLADMIHSPTCAHRDGTYACGQIHMDMGNSDEILNLSLTLLRTKKYSQ